MTFQQAITNARSELGDTYEGSYAYTNDDMLRYANEGVREAWSVRPSVRYDESTGALYDSASVFPSLYTDIVEIPLPVSIHHAVVYYIVYGCLSRDVTDEANAKRAEFNKTRFMEIVLR